MADVKEHHQHGHEHHVEKQQHQPPVDAAGDSSDEKTRKAPLPSDKERAELEATDNEALAQLALACFREHYDEAKACLDDDDNNKLVLTDPVDADRRTVLHYCVQNRSTRLAALVIERDDSLINTAEANGHTPLQLSVIAGNLPMAEHLLQSGADINRSDNNQHSVAHWAVASQYKDIQTFRRFIDLFDKYDGNLSSRDSEKATPLHYAAQSTTDNDKQKDEMIEYLVSKKVDVDCRDIYERTPLIWAATTGSDVGCRSLLKAGADANAKDTDGITALHCAASWGHVKCIETLLKEEAIVDSPDINGCTPLFYSVIHRQPESTKLLIRRKANTNHQDNKGRSVTHCAAAIGSTDCLEILRSNKADMWLQSKKKGHFPIHEAAIQSHTGAVKFLLEKCSKDRKKDMNLGNVNGRTCLHIGAMTGNFPLVDYLVKTGADKDAIMTSRERQMTPYDSAIAKRQPQCADYLLRHGAKSANEEQEEDEEEDDRKKKEEKEEEKDGDREGDGEEEADKATGTDVVVGAVLPGSKVKKVKKLKKPNLVTQMTQTGEDGGADGGAFGGWFDGTGDPKAKKNGKTTSPKKGKEAKGDGDGTEGEGDEQGGVGKKKKKTTKDAMTNTEWSGNASSDEDEKTKKKKKKKEETDKEDEDDQDAKRKKKKKANAKEEEEEEDDDDKKKKNKSKDKKKKKQRNGDNDKENDSDDDEPKRRKKKKGKDGQTDGQKETQKTLQRSPRQPHFIPRRQVTKKLYKPYFSLIQEQVRVFELKRLASLKMQKSLKFERQGNEKTVVRRLARDFNEDARPEDRVSSGQFSSIKDFQKHLKGEYQEADEWGQRLKKIEKVNPLYDSRPGHYEELDERTRLILPPVARQQKQQQYSDRGGAGTGGRGRATKDDDDDNDRRRRRRYSDDDDDDSANDKSGRYHDDYDSSDDDNRSNNNGNHGNVAVVKKGIAKPSRAMGRTIKGKL